jgi:predicted alpha/beta-fold hydrolase
VVNSRGCAGSKITNSMLYNARATWDVRQTVKWAKEKWPRRKMFGVGFSLGANILTTVGTLPLKMTTMCNRSKSNEYTPFPENNI